MRPLFVQCPFYGFRWPPGKPELFQVGGNECGLDLDAGSACEMEAQGRNIDYNCCPVAEKWKPILNIARHEIRFRAPESADVPSLDQRLQQVMRAR